MPGMASQEENASVRQQCLNEGWHFRQFNLGKWLPATVPGTVHTDLVANGLIPDPFYRTNEQEVQWVDKVNWEYTLTFRPDEVILGCRNQRLVLHGLDTYADVYLNDELVCAADNMFRTWMIPVEGKLLEGDNTLRIRFHSPITRGLEEMERYGLALPADNDYSQFGGMGKVRVSVYTRKAPYHYGWDWGPRLVPSGIWRPVVLEGWSECAIEDLFIRQPSVTRSLAKLEAEVTYLSDKAVSVRIDLLHRGKVLARLDTQSAPGKNRISLPFSIKNPRLWWSNGLGEATLYDFEVRISQGKRLLADKSVTTGLRSARLVRRPDEKGESFYIELNGVPVFIKGTNAIPGDNFLPRITRADYEKMVLDAKNANMNMIRIWGGGIYEADCFYEFCNRHGIMVWQDFPFACAMYPGNPAFLESVRLEAIDNITRLRNHPSLVLWCGNNEVDVAWARWGWKRRHTEAEQQHITEAYTALAHRLLPELVAQYTDGRDYWPSSPMSGSEPGAHELRPATSGDNHYWGVWGERHRLEQYETYIGRFMSEYGFQSFPELETVKTFALPGDYSLESEVMTAHQRSAAGNGRIREYMEWYYRQPEDFEQFLYLSQVLQARAMRIAMHSHRRNMPYCMGSLVWQHNDCWPAASWSTTDYHHRWKAAHYALRDACKPVILAPRIQGDSLELWCVNDLQTSQPAAYQVQITDFSGRILRTVKESFQLEANTSLLVKNLSVAALLQETSSSDALAVITLYGKNNQVTDQHHCYFTEPKNLHLPADPGLQVKIIKEKGKTYLEVTTRKLACNVFFYLAEGHLDLSDNYLDILPGRTYRLEVRSPENLPAESAILLRHV